MLIRKSPGGSIYPYYYKDGELFGMHFGSFLDDEDGLLARMQAEEAFLAGTSRSLPMWIDFYESRLTDRVLAEFLQGFYRLRARVTRLALVGCSARDQRRVLRSAHIAGIELPFPLRFFDDPEEAKSWLVGRPFEESGL